VAHEKLMQVTLTKTYKKSIAEITKIKTKNQSESKQVQWTLD
jgi:hypothetical protein